MQQYLIEFGDRFFTTNTSCDGFTKLKQNFLCNSSFESIIICFSISTRRLILYGFFSHRTNALKRHLIILCKWQFEILFGSFILLLSSIRVENCRFFIFFQYYSGNALTVRRSGSLALIPWAKSTKSMFRKIGYSLRGFDIRSNVQNKWNSMNSWARAFFKPSNCSVLFDSFWT